MKRTLIALLSVLVVMLFAVSAFALHAVPEMYEYTPSVVKSKTAQIEIGGHIRVRGELNDNYADFNDNNAADNTRSAFDQRARLALRATVSPNTFGVIEFEANAMQNDDSWDWANCDAAQGTYQKGNCKPTGVTTRQAYISHQGKDLGILGGFKVGHMPIALGNGIFFDHGQYGDDAIITWVSPMDGMEVSLNALKLDENSSAFSDDTDAYVGTFSGSFGPANVSADVTHVNDNGFDATGSNDLTLWNIGARADFAAGPAKIKVDGEFQTGTIDNGVAAGTDLDIGGYAFLVGADVNAGPVTVSVEAAYGSGDDIATNDENEQFVTSLSQGERYTYLYDQKACTAASTPGNCMTNTGLTNTWYVGVGASAKPMSDLKVSADVFYLNAVEEISTAAGFDETDLGVEVDTHVEYQIDSNLVYYVEAGYLFAGDFYANISGSTTTIDDPYSIRNGIILTF